LNLNKVCKNQFDHLRQFDFKSFRAARIATEKDPELLRQVALLLASENERLSKRLAVATCELAAREGATSEQLNLQIAELERDLQRIRDKAFESPKY